MESEKTSYLADLRDALANRDLEAARGVIEPLHPADVALLLESLPPTERLTVWDVISDDEGEILVELNDEVRQGLLADMDPEEVVAATEGMELDDLADVVADMSKEITDKVIESLSEADRKQLQSVLAYPEDSAGGLMDPDTISVRPDVTLDVVMRYLRVTPEMDDKTPAVFVVDRDHRFIGLLYLSRLITHDPEQTVGMVMDTSIDPIPANATAAEVAIEFQTRNLFSTAVVDDEGKMIGQITADDVMNVIQEQAEHDILSMAGLDEEDDMFAPVVTSAQRRAIWLGVNLGTAFLASAVVALFQPALDKIVMLAVLMPVVASMGGIAGSQTLTLMIRGIALGRVQDSNARWLLAKEISVGLLNGVIWSIVVAIVTILFFSTWEVGLVIAAALMISLITAAFAGFIIPLVLYKLKIDPALAGTVVLTTLTDIIGFGVFLGLGTIFLL
ncbi:MAG: magnesium transporter [Gammaproteobacteria bacterium]|nr:magnesium transporter [Gammaproteobacteria bacterium]